MKASKAAGVVPPSGVRPGGMPPRSATFALVSGSFIDGVDLGAEPVDDRRAACARGTWTPNQAVACTSGKPASAVVGTSGRAGLRIAVVTASARSRPSRRWPMTRGQVVDRHLDPPGDHLLQHRPGAAEGHVLHLDAGLTDFSSSPVRCSEVPMPERCRC